MSIMVLPRFAADPTIEAEWLAIESRLVKLETGVREWRISLGLPGTEPRQDFTDPAEALLPSSGEETWGENALPDPSLPERDEEPRREGALPERLAAVADALRSALTTISTLMDRASQTTLSPRGVESLRASVDTLASWPLADPSFEQARKLSASVWASGVLSLPSQRPTFPEQVLSECRILLGYLDSGT